MAQILAQNKMEELIRTLSLDSGPASSFQEGAPSVFPPEGPGSFQSSVLMEAEDVSAFAWIAEAKPSTDNAGRLDITLHVYVTQTRIRPQKASEPDRDFYVPDDWEWFSFKHALNDNSVEVITGKEKLRILSAVALP
jgi:hypothetical protein